MNVAALVDRVLQGEPPSEVILESFPKTRAVVCSGKDRGREGFIIAKDSESVTLRLPSTAEYGGAGIRVFRRSGVEEG